MFRMAFVDAQVKKSYQRPLFHFQRKSALKVKRCSWCLCMQHERPLFFVVETNCVKTQTSKKSISLSNETFWYSWKFMLHKFRKRYDFLMLWELCNLCTSSLVSLCLTKIEVTTNILTIKDITNYCFFI